MLVLYLFAFFSIARGSAGLFFFSSMTVSTIVSQAYPLPFLEVSAYKYV